jgi:hypothetical protein
MPNGVGIDCCETPDCNQPDPTELEPETLFSLFEVLQNAFPTSDFGQVFSLAKDSKNTTYISNVFFSYALNSGVPGLEAVSTALFSTGTLKSELVNRIVNSLPESLRGSARNSIANAIPNDLPIG